MPRETTEQERDAQAKRADRLLRYDWSKMREAVKQATGRLPLYKQRAVWDLITALEDRSAALDYELRDARNYYEDRIVARRPSARHDAFGPTPPGVSRRHWRRAVHRARAQGIPVEEALTAVLRASRARVGS